MDEEKKMEEGKRIAVWTVNKEEHKMKLTTLAITRLEERMGGNLLTVLNGDGNNQGMPRLGTMLQIVCEGLKTYDKDITLEKTYNLFDEYVEEGHCQTEFAYGPFIDLYTVSGFFPEKNKSEVKKIQKRMGVQTSL